MSEHFEGRVAFITGAAAGFGRAFARALHAAGASVAAADIDGDGAERTAAELGTNAIAVACDVGNQESVSAAVRDTVERLGGVDLLINNAGLHFPQYTRPFSALTHDEIRAVFDVNVMGVINCSLACRESMRERGGGAILNMSSIGGYLAVDAYCVTKLTVRGLTIAFAHDFAADRIRVNAIAPSLTATEHLLAHYPAERFDEFVETKHLIKRRGEPEDAVKAMMFLCSDEASFITGETVRVSGGAGLSI